MTTNEDHTVVTLSDVERRDAAIMVRYATEAGYRRLLWSVPNDASWPANVLANVPVDHDGLTPGRLDLFGARPFGMRCPLCALVRDTDGHDVVGVPGEEWLRAPVAPMDLRPPPTRRREFRFAAAALGIAVPAAVIGGIAVTGEDVPARTVVKASPFQKSGPDERAARPGPTEIVVPNANAWAADLRVRLASVDRQLTQVERAETAWRASAAAKAAKDRLPPEVIALQKRHAALEQVRAVLRADLALWEEAQNDRDAFEQVQQRLAELDSAAALDAESQIGQRLRDQRERVAVQIDERRADLRETGEAVESVVAMPPPADVKPVDELVTTVVTLANEPPHPQPPSDHEGPVVAAGREIDAGQQPEVVDGSGDDDRERDDDRSEPGRHHTQDDEDRHGRDASHVSNENANSERHDEPRVVQDTVDTAAGHVDDVTAGPTSETEDDHTDPGVRTDGSSDADVPSSGSENDVEAEAVQDSTSVPDPEPRPELEPEPASTPESEPESELEAAPVPDRPIVDASQPPAGIDADEYRAAVETARAEISPQERAQFDRDVAEFKQRVDADVERALASWKK